MREIQQAANRRASRALLEHIRNKKVSVPVFAEANGLDRLRVQRAIHGKPAKMEAGFALALERATGGEVPAIWWSEPTEEPIVATGTEGNG